MKRTFPADASRLTEIREFVRTRTTEEGFADALSADLVLAVSEAAANAILHSGSSTVTVDWQAGQEHLVVEIHDDGVFRSRVPMPEIEGVGGHGIPLMMALVDEIEIQEGSKQRPGTLVRLVVRRGRGSIAS